MNTQPLDNEPRRAELLRRLNALRNSPQSGNNDQGAPTAAELPTTRLSETNTPRAMRAAKTDETEPPKNRQQARHRQRQEAKRHATIAELAKHKHLDEAFLRKRFGLYDDPHGGGVVIPYNDIDGSRARSRRRELTETAHPTTWYGKKGEMRPYIDKQTLEAALVCGVLAINEGCTDRWTLESHGIPAMGIPGASFTKLVELRHVEGIPLLLAIREPDEAGKAFVASLVERLREIGYTGTFAVVDLQVTSGVKDPSELHVRDSTAFEAEWQRAVESGETFQLPIVWPPLYTPPELDPVALHGLAGEIVCYLDPLVEATPVGMLLEILCAFGNAAGPESHALVVDDKHPARLFVCLVGPTSTGGKGSADAAIRPFIRAMDEDWFNAGRRSGFGSGEAIVAYLSGDHAKPGEATERRLLIFEPEFTRLLALNNRDATTISSRLRQLFDDDRVHDALRGKNTIVEGAHVSIIAHVVPDELRLKLPKGDIHGGFANRFLFAFTRTTKRIPSPKRFDPAIVGDFAKRLSEALLFARRPRIMQRTAEADDRWDRFYGSHRSEGLTGEIVAREDAQRLRLAVAFALLDCSDVIRPEHILAAEGVVRYCVDSADYIFADHPEARQAEQLLEAAREAWPRGLTGVGCHAVFGNNVSADRMRSLKATLVERGLARIEETATGGRNASLFYANARIKRTKPRGQSLSSSYSFFAQAEEGTAAVLA